MGKRAWLLILAAALYLVSLGACFRAAGVPERMEVLLARGVDAAAGERIFAGEAEVEAPVGFCLWGSAGKKTVSCQETGRYAQVEVELAAGNPELLNAGALCWREGCLIDRATAQALFGTEVCQEQRLRLGDRELPVLGVISAARPTLIALAEEKDGEILNHCVLALPAAAGEGKCQEFLVRWGLNGRVLDEFFLWTLMRNLLLLFPAIVLLRAGGWLGRGWRALSLSRLWEQRRLFGRVLLALGLTAATVCFLGRQLLLPPDLLPSRWSDFSHWGNWWAGQKEAVLEVLLTPPSGSQLQIRLDMIKSMVCSTAAALLALWAVRRERNGNPFD